MLKCKQQIVEGRRTDDGQWTFIDPNSCLFTMTTAWSGAKPEQNRNRQCNVIQTEIDRNIYCK